MQWDSNVWITSLGAPDTRRLQVNASTCVSVKIARHLYYEAEVSRFGGAGPLQTPVMQTLHAIAYNVTPALNVSAAVQWGLTTAAPTRTYLFGVVFFVAPPHQPTR